MLLQACIRNACDIILQHRDEIKIYKYPLFSQPQSSTTPCYTVGSQQYREKTDI
jgi:hypothetical protein